MKRMLMMLAGVVAALMLAACGRSAITPRAHTATPVPELNVTRLPPTSRPITLDSADTVPPPTAATVPPTPTPTLTLTPSPRPTHVPVTPTSSGPLSVAVYVANCRNAPSPGKPGNVVVRISIEASGGSGDYHYFNEGVESVGKFIDITWERGTRLIGTVRITSRDGQSVKKEYDIPIGELTCQ